MRKQTCLLLFLMALSLHGQEKGDSEALLNYAKKAMRFSMFYPQEKVYLHLDNTGYFKGETIWFKAYVTRIDTEAPTDLSKVLYVELLNPTGDVVERRKLHIEADGTAYGDIQLDSTIAVTGFHEIRAFTRYMTNWGTNACFSRVIPIFKEPTREGDYSDPKIDQLSYRHRLNDERLQVNDEGNSNIISLTEEEDAQKEKKQKGDLRMHFYPEGGNMVRGLPCKVAFTVTDGDNRPLATKVSLKDEQGNTVVTVSSDAEGRGAFLMQGTEPHQVWVQNENGNTKRFDLPKALEEGCTLQLDVTDADSIRFNLYATSAMQGRKLGYIVMNRSKLVRCDTLTAQSQQQIVLPRSQHMEGVSQFTLFDSEGGIVAERLFFVYPKSRIAVPVKVSSTTANIRPCGKVKFNLTGAPNASLSFSAVDANGMVNGNEGNIFTWMLLASDLKGYIAHPEYYLESDDEAHRQATDLLMLVQGWRRYDWNLMTGQSMFEKYQTIETGLNLFGRLGHKAFQRKAVDNVWLDAKMYNKLGQVVEGTTKTDSVGRYVFTLPDISGDWNLTINTGIADKKGNWKDVDYFVGIDRNFSPASKYLSPLESDCIPTNDRHKVKWKMTEEDEEWVSMTNKNHVLQNVTVQAKKWGRSSGWKHDESWARSNSNIYYQPEKDADRLADEGQVLPNLPEWLMSKNNLFAGDAFPKGLDSLPITLPVEDPPLALGVYTDGPSYKNRPIIWVVDNYYWTITQVPQYLLARGIVLGQNNNPGLTRYESDNDIFLERLNFSIDEVKSVYISEDLEKAHAYFLSSEVDAVNPVVVYVYTYGSVLRNQKGLRRTHFQGYSEPSVFKMEDYNVIPPMEDYRRTLYWAPDVKTDETGKATVEFWNNSSCTEMYISCEGMTQDGKFVVVED